MIEIYKNLMHNLKFFDGVTSEIHNSFSARFQRKARNDIMTSLNEIE